MKQQKTASTEDPIMRPPDSQSQGTDFDRCDFYTCRDPDLLSLASPEEAIEESLDGYLPDGDTAAAILQHAPITVVGYRPRLIPDSVVQTLAKDALERIEEHLSEDFADPDGYGLFSGTASARSIAELTKTIRRVCNRAHVWACDEVATRTYSPQEVLAMMRDHVPEWFEADQGGTDSEKPAVQP